MTEYKDLLCKSQYSVQIRENNNKNNSEDGHTFHEVESWKLEQNSLMEFYVNPIVPNALFLYPMEASKSRKGFWWFQGIKKGRIGSGYIEDI